MADVVPVGTFVAAVLEHAGYLTQARFLVEFQSFFRDAGALIYLLAGAGGVVSVAIYGSYRAAQYLLFGPALFWFLVGPTTETEGVLWKLGGGTYLGELRSKGKEASEDFRRKVMKKVEEKDSGNINVAIGFWLFAYPMSEFVNEFVDILLKKENTEDLTANHKVGALELIAKAIPYEGDHIHRMENFAAKCSGMTTAAMAAGEAMMRAERTGDQAAAEAKPELKKLIDYHIRELERESADEFIETRGSGFDQLIRQQAQGSISTKAKGLLVNGNPVMSISCADAWHLLAEETWYASERDTPRILTLASGVWQYEQALDYVCRELTQKTQDGPEGAGECNLKPALALAMLHNHLINSDTWGRVLSRHWNDRDVMNPKKDKILTGPMAKNFAPVIDPATGRYEFDTQNGQLMMRVYKFNKNAGPGPVDKDKAVFSWAPVSPIIALHGRDHAMWVATREYETVRLRQTIYTYAMQMPYYQGLCLYFIAVLYPFMALIVLLPGRALHFINVPLAYLWVKSWDIGFATVIILDKIMYNLLPDWHVHQDLRTLGSWVQPKTLARVFAQGFNFDPMGSLHIYYAVIAMVTTSIPVLTGAIVLRTRRAVLSSFTDAVGNQAKGRGNYAGNMFSIAHQNERNRMMMQIAGSARLSAIGGPGGIEGGLKGVSARSYAIGRALTEGVSNANIAGLANLNPSQLAKLPEAAMKAAETYYAQKGEMAVDEARFEAAMRAAFDPILGRSGYLQMYNEAYASAMDGGGGFELSGISDNAIGEYASLMAKKTVFAMANRSNLIESLARQAADAGGNTVLGRASTNRAEGIVRNADLMNVLMVGNLATHIAGDQSIIGEDGRVKLSVAQIRKLVGAEAYTDEEYLARVFHIDRNTLADPAVREGLKSSFGSAFDSFFSPLINSPAPGGPSRSIDIYLGTLGGDRVIASLPNFMAAPQGPAANPFGEVADPSTRPDWGTLNTKTKQFYEDFADLMQFRNDQLTLQMNEDSKLKAMYPGVEGLYNQEVEQLRTRLIDHFGGREVVFELWNKTVGTRQGFQPFATVEDAGRISTSQLAHLALEFDQRRTQQIRDGLGALTIDGQRINDTQRRVIESELEYNTLPAGLALLEQSNSRLAMTLVEDWFAQIKGGAPVYGHSMHFGKTQNDVVTTPSGFLRAPER